MAFPLLAAAPSIISGISSLFGASKQRKAQRELMNYQRSLRLDPVTGRFGQISVNDGNVSGGQFEDLQSQLGGAAGDVLGSIDFSGGLPPEISDALGMLQSRLTPGVNPMLGGLLRGQRQTGAVAGQAMGDLFGADPNAGLMAQLFSGASGLAGDVGRSFDDVRSSTLSNLRAAAMPENQRAVDSTLTRLFSQGRLGSTGGANIIGRLAESQNQQDLGFQLAAGDEARAASSDVTNRFQSLFQGGLGLDQAGQQRTAGAYSRFAGATGLGADLGTEAFRRTSALDEEGFSRLLDNFKAVAGTATLPGALQSQKIGQAQGLLSSSASLQDMLSQAFGDALGLAQAKTNVRMAGAGLNTQTMGSPNYSASPVADAFGALGAGMNRPGSFDLMSLLSSLGNRRRPTQDLGDLISQG